MTTTQLRQSERTRPFVAVVCSVPLLGEAMRSVLEFADVQPFAAKGGDVDGLLRWLRPNALIVDNAESADEAIPYAAEHELPVVHLGVTECLLRVYRGGAWEIVSNGEEPKPEAIRNVVAGAVFSREGTVA
jgi:hypothetical protein